MYSTTSTTQQLEMLERGKATSTQIGVYGSVAFAKNMVSVSSNQLNINAWPAPSTFETRSEPKVLNTTEVYGTGSIATTEKAVDSSKMPNNTPEE